MATNSDGRYRLNARLSMEGVAGGQQVRADGDCPRDRANAGGARTTAHIGAMATIPMATTFSAVRGRAATRPRAVAAWLLVVAALVALMVSVGGVTRLTESGLSIVKWQPVEDMVPPASARAWDAEFGRYKATSQYRLQNRGMTLAQYKGIYFWEWLHRLLGRVIGLAFALPLAWFAFRRRIPAGYGVRLGVLLALGGVQGAIGAWMVASGFQDRVDVLPERLAIHLLTALTLLAALIWTALDLRGERVVDRSRPRAWIAPLFAVLVAQYELGAFTAGLHAGHASDTWPLMFGTAVPPLAPAWWADAVTVQFAHRTTAYLAAALALWAAWTCRAAGARAWALGALVLVQFALGVATIVSGVALPLAALHQASAVALLAAAVGLAHWARATHQLLDPAPACRI